MDAKKQNKNTTQTQKSQPAKQEQHSNKTTPTTKKSNW